MGTPVQPPTTRATARPAATPSVATSPIPDSNGQMVAPKPSGSTRPEKAWVVPDAAGTTDNVSAADAEYLATVRPVVPYKGPDGSMSNATLIAMGRKACTAAGRYEAGGVVVSGPGAEAVHKAALKVYC